MPTKVKQSNVIGPGLYSVLFKKKTMTLETETLQKIVKEINETWIGGYSARLEDGEVAIYLDDHVVLRMNEKGQTWGLDKDAMSQLEYIMNHV
jgi:hypothetical protein